MVKQSAVQHFEVSPLIQDWKAQENNCIFHLHPSVSFHIFYRNTTQKQTDRTNKQIILNPFFPR